MDGKGNAGVGNSLNLNLFAYTYQNPVRYIDPDGNSSSEQSELKGIKKSIQDVKNGMERSKKLNRYNPNRSFSTTNNYNEAANSIYETSNGEFGVTSTNLGKIVIKNGKLAAKTDASSKRRAKRQGKFRYFTHGHVKINKKQDWFSSRDGKNNKDYSNESKDYLGAILVRPNGEVDFLSRNSNQSAKPSYFRNVTPKDILAITRGRITDTIKKKMVPLPSVGTRGYETRYERGMNQEAANISGWEFN